jgi:hypothetical protein
MKSRVPDRRLALAMLEMAEVEMAYALGQERTEEAAMTLFRAIYESFRAVGNALLVNRGIESDDHVSQIDEVIALGIPTERPLVLLQEYRTTRHDLNYHGIKPTMAQFMDFMDFADRCWKPVLREAKKKVKG